MRLRRGGIIGGVECRSAGATRKAKGGEGAHGVHPTRLSFECKRQVAASKKRRPFLELAPRSSRFFAGAVRFSAPLAASLSRPSSAAAPPPALLAVLHFLATARAGAAAASWLFDAR